MTKSDTVGLVVEAIKKNGDDIDWGLGRRLVYHAEDVPLPTGRADLLLMAEDRSTLYVVEILPGECSAEDVGRLLGHCGWLGKDSTPPSPATDTTSDTEPMGTHSSQVQAKNIRGILLATNFNAGALCALGLCAGLTAVTFSFSLRLSKHDRSTAGLSS
jgi:hypothetical protein